MPKGGRKLRCQLRRGLSLSSIFEAKKPFFKFCLLFDVSKTKANDALIIGLRDFERHFTSFSNGKLKGCPKNIKELRQLLTEHQLIVELNNPL